MPGLGSIGLGLTATRNRGGPIPLSGLVGWLDPSPQTCFSDAGVTPETVTGTVQQFNNKGTGGALAQGTGSLQPTLQQVSGRYYLRFDGVDDILASAAPFTTSLLYTMFAVHKHNGTDNGLICHNGGGDGYGIRYVTNNISPFGQVLFEGVANVNFGAGGSSAAGGYKLWQARRGASGLDAWADGNQVITSFTTSTPNAPTTRFSLGNGGVALKPAACDVGEVLVYDRALSDAERLLVQGYLQNKWGVT